MRKQAFWLIGLIVAVAVGVSAQDYQRGGVFQPGRDVEFGGIVTGLSSIKSSSPSAGIGYAAGAGSSVTQITNRTTGVTINAICGSITTDTTSLGAELSAEFTVTNSAVAIGDTVVVSQRSGAVGVMTDVWVSAVAAGSFKLRVGNGNAAAGVAETGAIIINFAVIKAVTS